MAQENCNSLGGYTSHHEHHHKEDPKIVLEDSWSDSNEDGHKEANEVCLMAVGSQKFSGKMRALKQKTRDLDVEFKKLKAQGFYGLSSPHKLRRELGSQRNIIDEGEIDNLTMEQYLTLPRGNQAPGVVKPENGGNVNFEIKSQFMRELREDTFSRNKNDDAHKHVERTAKQLEDIHNFKQEGDKTLYQVWERNIDSGNSNSDRNDAIVNKLDFLGRDMKKLKKNVHAIQVGCQTCGEAHLDKECPLNEEAKCMEEVKYGEFGRPFPNNSRNNGRFNRGVSEYDQPSSGERRPTLTEIINKYMEEVAKRHAEQDELLKKIYQDTETNREAHDKIIQGLETKHRVEEALVHETMESLKKIKINRPLLKEIRKMDNYVKHIKDLVANKPRTKEDEEIRMNPRCSALLQNQLPPKEQDPGSFILPCSNGRLDFNNALADLGASISIIPLSIYKRLGMGNSNQLTWERILKDLWRESFGDEEDDIKENSEDPEECGEDKVNVIIGAIYDKLNDDWFNGTSEDENDLEGILDYLEPRSYDGFIDLDDEAYNKRKCRLLGLTYEDPPLIIIEKVKVTRYTIGPEEIYTKVKVLEIDEMPRTRHNVAAIRARLMEKMANDGSGQAKFSRLGNGIRGQFNSFSYGKKGHLVSSIVLQQGLFGTELRAAARLFGTEFKAAARLFGTQFRAGAGLFGTQFRAEIYSPAFSPVAKWLAITNHSVEHSLHTITPRSYIKLL
ncbi:hypothetical protein Tco_1371560 [Tanacetum coccineum]